MEIILKTTMKTKIYNNILHGDWVKCSQCGAIMLLPCGADQCPECCGCGTCGLACQTRAIQMVEGRPNINTDRCIKCGSCYTMCPRSWLPEKQIKKETGL